MTKQEVKKLASDLMSKHSLLNWRFEFNTRKTALGICKHRFQVIGISSFLLPAMDYDMVKNTLLHEIAHALVGAGHGHDYVWRRKALEIGCSAERTTSINHDHNMVASAKYKAQCPDCGHIHTRHRMPKRLASCNCLGRFDATRTLNYIQQY